MGVPDRRHLHRTLRDSLDEAVERIGKAASVTFVYVFYITSLYCLAIAIKRIDISIAYAIWAGMGTALIAVVGVVYFKEPLTILKVAFVALIVVGSVGLNRIGAGH